MKAKKEDGGAGFRARHKPKEATDEALGGLLKEAAGLLRSLSGPSLRALRTEEDEAKITALGTRDRRALLDEGATHCLGKTFGQEEWSASEEVEVTVAQGKVCLRRVPWSLDYGERCPTSGAIGGSSSSRVLHQVGREELHHGRPQWSDGGDCLGGGMSNG